MKATGINNHNKKAFGAFVVQPEYYKAMLKAQKLMLEREMISGKILGKIGKDFDVYVSKATPVPVKEGFFPVTWDSIFSTVGLLFKKGPHKDELAYKFKINIPAEQEYNKVRHGSLAATSWWEKTTPTGNAIVEKSEFPGYPSPANLVKAFDLSKDEIANSAKSGKVFDAGNPVKTYNTIVESKGFTHDVENFVSLSVKQYKELRDAVFSLMSSR